MISRHRAVPETGTYGRTARSVVALQTGGCKTREISMNSIIYLVGLVVVVMAILSFVGIH